MKTADFFPAWPFGGGKRVEQWFPLRIFRRKKPIGIFVPCRLDDDLNCVWNGHIRVVFLFIQKAFAPLEWLNADAFENEESILLDFKDKFFYKFVCLINGD